MFFLFFLVALLLPRQVFAEDIHLNRFWPNNSTGSTILNIPVNQSYVEVINTGTSTIDLTNYLLVDSTATNQMNLYGSLGPSAKAIFHFQNYLNSKGDTVYLKKDTSTTIEDTSYCIGSCSGIDMTNMFCGYLPPNSSTWQASDNVDLCYMSGVFPTPTLTPIPTLTPTPTTQPSATSVPLAHISINLSASTFKISQNYSYTFSITSAVNGDNYAVKAYGGVNDNYGFENQEGSNWENYTSDWSSYTTYNTQNNTINNSGVFRVKSDEPTGSASLHFKCRDITTGNDCSNTSDYTVNIQAPNPTPTPTPIINTPIPTPTDDPNITPTDVPSPTFEPSVTTGDNGLVQGVSATDQITPVLTPTASKSKSSLAGALPFILIGFGGLLLCVPLIITKLKH